MSSLFTSLYLNIQCALGKQPCGNAIFKDISNLLTTFMSSIFNSEQMLERSIIASLLPSVNCAHVVVARTGQHSLAIAQTPAEPTVSGVRIRSILLQALSPIR